MNFDIPDEVFHIVPVITFQRKRSSRREVGRILEIHFPGIKRFGKWKIGKTWKAWRDSEERQLSNKRIIWVASQRD